MAGKRKGSDPPPLSASEIRDLRLAGKLRGPKYDLEHKDTQVAKSRQELSSSDARELARLVGKYGREAVVAVARAVVPRGPGRPSRGLLPYYERMALTDWIETVADEYRRAGSVQPYKDAELDLYELEYGGQEELRDVQKFRRTIKKARQQGRRDYQELARKIQADPKKASAAGFSWEGLPRWLVGRK
jgi:hypothetical protein